MTVTPHDIAQLALTRRIDPELAMTLATEAGKMTTENVNERMEADQHRTKVGAGFRRRLAAS